VASAFEPSFLTRGRRGTQDPAVEVRRWEEEPVEQLGPSIGRQMLHTETMTVAVVRLATGAVVPRHSHANEQVANVLSGRLRFLVGERDEVTLSAGESIALPADVPHEVEALEDSVVIDVFSPVREDWVRGDDAYLRGGADQASGGRRSG
jgi:quercetin dioxygenase-like cupin family protein